MNRVLVSTSLGLVSLAAAIVGGSIREGRSGAGHPSARPSGRAGHPPQGIAALGSGGGQDADPLQPPRTGAIDPRANALRATTLSQLLKDYPSRVELEQRAALVEQEANHELRRLVPLLGLSKEQEDKVFKALVQSSPRFVPGMNVGGEPLAATPGEAKEALLAELTDAQVAAYLQDADEQSSWWQEYLGKVSARMEAETPVPGIAADPATAPVDVGDSGEILPGKESRQPSAEE